MTRRAPPAAAARPAARLKGCTNLKLRQLARVVARHYDHHVAATGLRGTQYSLLSHVVKLGPLGLGELAARLRLSPSALSRNLQPLLAQGWVVVEPGTDARSRIARATPDGVALRAQAQRAWKAAQLSLNAQLGPARVAALHALLDESLGLMDALAGPQGADDDAGPEP
jgi:DNA-binding MarR family transcriptional regulator